MRRATPAALRAVESRASDAVRCPTTGCVSRSRGDHVVEIDDPVPLRPRAHRLRSAPARRGDALPRRSRSSARIASASARPSACTSRCGRPTPIASASSAISTAGTGACTRCACSCPSGVWEIFIPDLPDGERYKFEIRTRDGAAAEEDRSVRRSRSRRRRRRRRSSATSRGYAWGDARGCAARRDASALARSADGDLRSAPRIVGARAGGRQPVPDLSRAGRTGSCRT